MGFYTVGSSVRKTKVIEKIGLTPKIHLQESKIYHQDKMKKGFFPEKITLKEQNLVHLENFRPSILFSGYGDRPRGI